MRRSRLIWTLCLGCLWLHGCADIASRQEAYVVRPQDTLYSIAWRYGLDFRDLARWNNIGSDFRITVGQALTLTPRAVAGAAQSRRAVPAVPAGPPAPAGTASSGVRPGTPRAEAAQSGLNWEWPTVPSGAPRPVQGGGILLSGRLGQDVRAAAAGRVVYNGTGIRGYGNLIIIKHGENWLSAYAHNRESLVHEGEEISRGAIIGHMGEGSPGKPVLYFEIRRNGKPIDPLSCLPHIK